MKIFLSFLQSDRTYPIPAYNFWQYYIKNGIAEAGYEWIECADADWALGLVPQSKEKHQKWKEDTWSKTIEYLKKNPVNIFLSYLYPQQIDSSAIKEIQKMGIPCVNFYCDNVRDFTKIPAEYGVFDLNWVPEHKAIKMFQRAGFNYIHLPMPVYVDQADRKIKKEKYKQVTFLGSRDIQRQILLEEIIRLDPDIPLAIYGNSWDKTAEQLNPVAVNYSLVDRLQYQFKFLNQQGIKAYRNKIMDRNYTQDISPAMLAKYRGGHQHEQYKMLTAESMITMGVNRYPSFHFPLHKPDTYSRLRDIEAPMYGACYITEYTEGIEDLYDIDKEIAVYKSPEDFIEKVKKMLVDPAKRKSIRVNGQKRALGDHNIVISINKIINKLS